MRSLMPWTGMTSLKQDMDRLFGKFEQLDSTYAREQTGTGLGLALTKRLVEMHGGTIWAASEGEGMGSVFSVLLPMRPAATSVPPDQVPAAQQVQVVADRRLRLVEQIMQRRDVHLAVLGQGQQDLQAGGIAQLLEQVGQILDGLLGHFQAGVGLGRAFRAARLGQRRRRGVQGKALLWGLRRWRSQPYAR